MLHYSISISRDMLPSVSRSRYHDVAFHLVIKDQPHGLPNLRLLSFPFQCVVLQYWPSALLAVLQYGRSAVGELPVPSSPAASHSLCDHLRPDDTAISSQLLFSPPCMFEISLWLSSQLSWLPGLGMLIKETRLSSPRS